MTRNTNRNYIKPIFFSIAFVMMIFFCSIFAIMAFQSASLWDSVHFNSLVHNASCFAFNQIISTVSFVCLFTFYALVIFSYDFLSFIAFQITYTFCASLVFAVIFQMIFSSFFALSKNFTTSIMANFAMILTTIFRCSAFAKISKRLNLFASRAFFRYDFGSHFRLLIRRFWLKPVAAYTVVGLFYCRLLAQQFKRNNKYILGI